ncbi:MAG: 30S ribosomal protein S11 [Patescibacteria group bacterium]
MGKKRVIKKSTGSVDEGLRSRSLSRATKKKVSAGILHIQSTYNNTRLQLTDQAGNSLAWSSSGALGFSGAKKGTTFAAGKVGELLADRAEGMGVKEVEVVIRGVGSGREAAIRAFASRGIAINAIKDATPRPFNGPKPKKPRRV